MLKRGGWSKLSLLYFSLPCIGGAIVSARLGRFKTSLFDAPASAADSPMAEWATVVPVARPVSAVGKGYLFTQIILIK
jgi:hypothetical protein